MNDHTAEQRTGYIAGLRQLADLLEQHDQLPLPYHGSSTSLTFMFFHSGEDNRAALAEAVKVLPGRFDKSARGDYFDVDGSLHGLKIQLTAYRDEVCERVVVGTETVTVPATPATEAKPEQTVEREIVEWRCHPILADQAADEQPAVA